MSVLLPHPSAAKAPARTAIGARLAGMARASRGFLLVVMLPTLVTAFYFGLIASNQYESSADFVVRHAESSRSNSDVGQLLGFTLGTGGVESDASAVQDYLLSHDAVATLRRENGLVDAFAYSDIDPLSRLWFNNPSPEWLLRFYRRQVDIRADDETGITHLAVHAFRPADAHGIAEKLLEMGEHQVNAINRRTYLDQVASAQRQFEDASRQLAAVESQLTSYRQSHADVDPADTGRVQTGLVANLTQNLVAARARLKAMQGAISPASPQYQAMQRQVTTLEAQVAAQSGKLGGNDHSVANRLGDYEELVIKRQEAAQVYAATAGQLKQAQADAQRKQLYLIRVVEPNLPVRSEYPQRLQIVLTVFGALVMLYAIGWLLWAGVREHAL